MCDKLHVRSTVAIVARASSSVDPIARYWLRIAIFCLPHLHLMPPLGRSPSEYCHDVWYGSTRMVFLPHGDLILKIFYLFRQNPRMWQTDRQIHTPHDGIGRAYAWHCAAKIFKKWGAGHLPPRTLSKWESRGKPPPHTTALACGPAWLCSPPTVLGLATPLCGSHSGRFTPNSWSGFVCQTCAPYQLLSCLVRNLISAVTAGNQGMASSWEMVRASIVNCTHAASSMATVSQENSGHDLRRPHARWQDSVLLLALLLKPQN